MKKIWIPLAVFTVVLISSCQQHTDKKQEVINQADSSLSAGGDKPEIDIRKLAHSDVFIDADLKEPIQINKIPVTEVPKFKAAVYRFYSHVKLEKGKYVCALKNGKEINISEKIFSAFLNNMNELNQQAAKARAGGGNMQMSEIDDAYLNSLLK